MRGRAAAPVGSARHRAAAGFTSPPASAIVCATSGSPFPFPCSPSVSGLTQLRLAALCAFAYALLAVSGVVQRFQRTGSLRGLVHGLIQPQLWIVLVIALLLLFGLFGRRAWAWWLGVAAALFGLFRIVSAYVQGGGFGRVPAAWTLIALALLIAMLLLLVPRKARLAANR